VLVRGRPRKAMRCLVGKGGFESFTGQCFFTAERTPSRGTPDAEKNSEKNEN
jgi:hypothetical protein